MSALLKDKDCKGDLLSLYARMIDYMVLLTYLACVFYVPRFILLQWVIYCKYKLTKSNNICA